jgi:S-adenosylmethionine:tRNA ribosyltransferase-isomerase
MKLEEFDYFLPSHLIAQKPAERRDEAKLMVLDRKTGKIAHRRFKEIINYFSPGDLLVVNNTKVIPGKLEGRKPTRGRVEILLLEKKNAYCWEILLRGKVKEKTEVFFKKGLRGEIKREGEKIFLETSKPMETVLEAVGEPPLPPYIKGKRKDDLERYQTVYAEKPGSVAAPTAGLHFTDRLLTQIKEKGIEIVTVTLHINRGTFLPIREKEVEKHQMYEEYFEISVQSAQKINKAKKKSAALFAVGTTVVRTLETMADENGKVKSGRGTTQLYIYPPYKFKLIDHLITNFHLPKSTLLVLVSAFAGLDLIQKAYQIAKEHQYRFFSYGDAMLIL